jgi:hypothetical protein
MYDLLQSIFISASLYTALSFRGASFLISCCRLYTGPFLAAVSRSRVAGAVLNSDNGSEAAINRRSIKE